MSDEKKRAFLNALDKTQQKHVPLFHCTEIRRMSKNSAKLIELIDSRNGLLDKMLSVSSINKQQKRSVEQHTTDENQVKTLHGIVSRGSLTTYKTFIRCLLETN